MTAAERAGDLVPGLVYDAAEGRTGNPHPFCARMLIEPEVVRKPERF
jgi:hypothetical protein